MTSPTSGGYVLIQGSVDEVVTTVDRAIARVVAQVLQQAGEFGLPREYVTVEEAAALLSRSVKTVRRYIANGQLRASKVRGGSSRVLVERASIDALLRRTTA